MISRRRAILLIAGVLILVVILAVNGVAASPPQQDPEFVFVVTTTEDHNDGFCNADCSLRDAIIAANQLDYHATILLPSGTYTLTLEGPVEQLAATGDLDVCSGLTIIGDGPETTIIDAGGMSGDPDRASWVAAQRRIEGCDSTDPSNNLNPPHASIRTPSYSACWLEAIGTRVEHPE